MSEVDGRGVGAAELLREWLEADPHRHDWVEFEQRAREVLAAPRSPTALEAADELYEAAEAFVENSGFAFDGAERYTYNAFELHKAHLRLKPALDRYRQAREKEGR